MPRTTNRAPRKGYLKLIKRFPLRSIRTEEELDAAMEVIRALLQDDLDAAGEDYLSALTDLVEVYENKVHPIPDASEADVLRLLMESNHLSQSQLAAKSGIAQSTISAVLSGTRSLTRDHIVELARLFHVSPAALLPASIG